MADLLPNLVALKGIFPEGIPSLVDCYYYPFYEETQGPAITFSSAVANVGTGRLEVIIGDEKIDNGQRVASATQRIYNTDNGFRDRDAGQFVFHTDPDGHNHWHFKGFELFELLDEDGRKILAKGNKEGFCMVDSFHYKSTANSPPIPQYYEEGCEDKSKKKMGGVSVGWADLYRPSDDGQCIDVSNIESGIYLLRLTANPNNSIETASKNSVEQIKIKLDKKKEGEVPILQTSS
jgi:hypothetical protein